MDEEQAGGRHGPRSVAPQGVHEISDMVWVNESQHAALGNGSPQSEEASVQEDVRAGGVQEGPAGAPPRELGGDRVTVMSRVATDHKRGRAPEGVASEAAGQPRRERVGLGPGRGRGAVAAVLARRRPKVIGSPSLSCGAVAGSRPVKVGGAGAPNIVGETGGRTRRSRIGRIDAVGGEAGSRRAG